MMWRLWRVPRVISRRVASAVCVLTIVSASTVFTSSSELGATPPGSLPQTTSEPNFSAGLNAQMHVLWRAITSNSPALAGRVFFPRAAYLRMKTGEIPNPGADYTRRLIGFLNLDVAAYHRLLSANPPVTFERVLTSPADAAWIAPGACENKIGYWHLPGVRLVFKQGHRVKSFAVASLISWRGIWYVVHLGPNPRPVSVGTVDSFHIGPGTPGPAGGC